MEDNKLILMVGVAGSGKSTVAKRLESEIPNSVRLSSDELRAKFGKGEDDQSVSARVYKHMEEQTKILLKQGFNVIVDATNVSPKSRKQFIRIARTLRPSKKVTAYFVDISVEEAKKRNQKRKESGGRDVPEWVIDKQFQQLNPPSFPEVDNVIKIH